MLLHESKSPRKIPIKKKQKNSEVRFTNSQVGKKKKKGCRFLQSPSLGLPGGHWGRDEGSVKASSWGDEKSRNLFQEEQFLLRPSISPTLSPSHNPRLYGRKSGLLLFCRTRVVRSQCQTSRFQVHQQTLRRSIRSGLHRAPHNNSSFTGESCFMERCFVFCPRPSTFLTVFTVVLLLLACPQRAYG